MTFNPTTEQTEALRLFETGASLKIEAGAGTGKTSTLRLLAESTDRRGQYLAFNKAIVVEAGEKMPANVRCNTAHSLAFRAFGRRYAHRLNSGRMRSTEIAARLGLDPLALDVAGERKVLSAERLAGIAMRSASRFCQTADEEPSRRHVPYIDGIDVPPVRGGQRVYDNNRLVAAYVEDAVREIWRDSLNPRGQLPYSHDRYLKAWQLNDPRIDADFVLFDEAQDANPVMVAIVAAQAGRAQIVWVGDSQQQIYSFTGAVNALATMPADGRTLLTQSFRFGPEVATVANAILDVLDADLRLVGTETIPSVVAPVAEPDAILTRTNAEAVRRVLGAISQGLRPHLVGGGGEILSFAKAADRLQRGQRTDHPDLACFDSWSEVLRYVEEDEQGSDLRLLVRLIDEFGVAVILDALDRMPGEADADLVVSTAHKSKGREWASVALGGDFPTAPEGEELRLLYVAVTRARRELDVSGCGWLVDLLSGSSPEPEGRVVGVATAPIAEGQTVVLAGGDAIPVPDAPPVSKVAPFTVYIGDHDPIEVAVEEDAVWLARSAWQTRPTLRCTVLDATGDLVAEFDR